MTPTYPKNPSPLRYPGGKAKLIPIIMPMIDAWAAKHPKWCYVEPFAGGASVGFAVATARTPWLVILNDVDEQVRNLLSVICGQGDWLARRVEGWCAAPDAAAKILARDFRSPRLRAAQTLLRNRLAHGGRISPGAGLIKRGERDQGLFSRWYPTTIARRIRAIHQAKRFTQVWAMDGSELVKRLGTCDPDTVMYIDPPYPGPGRRLYRHHQVDHERLFADVAVAQAYCIMSYNDRPDILALAERYKLHVRRVPVQTTHGATKNELIITNQP